jgi:flagellar FliL protein
MALQEKQPETKKAPLKGKKKIIIISGVITLIAAITGGGLYFGLNMNNPLAVEASDSVKTAEPAPAKKAAAPVTYPLEAFVVNIGDGPDVRYLKVKIELETTLGGEKVKKELDPFMPPLRDSILLLLTSKSFQDVQSLNGKTNLKGEILAIAKKVIPSGNISAVYFTDFVVQ